MPDRLTPEQRRRNMQAVKSKDSKIEKVLRKAMWRQGIRYRKHCKNILGTPDIVLLSHKIAIFCDSEFWHGYKWEIHKNDHKSNHDFWIKKIESNIKRDIEVNDKLISEGWKVLRFWGREILKDTDKCVEKIKALILEVRDMQQKKAGKAKSYLTNDEKAKITHLYNTDKNDLEQLIQKSPNSILYSLDRTEEELSKSADEAVHYMLELAQNDIPFPKPIDPKFSFIDLFAGIGGFRIAMQSLGGECVFSSEWDSAAQTTYKANFNEFPYGDITAQSTKDQIPGNFDVLCGGFPCQAFSIAGKRGGFEDTRGTLFFDVATIIKKHQPKAIFLENVKGLKNHDKGRTLATILKTLREDLDYYVPDPQIINAKDFGVPQNRERIFIVGFRKDLGINSFEYPSPSGIKVSFSDIKEKEVVSTKYYLSTVYLQTLINHKSRHESKGNGFGYEIIKDDQIANAVVVGGMGRERNLVYDNRITDFNPVTKIKGEVNREGIRKMTPREWARLQGFPEEFQIVVADASAYKQFGNSVAVPAIKATAKQIIEKLGSINVIKR